MAERLVLLLGAGASAQSGGPTHDRFLASILDGLSVDADAAARLAGRTADPFDLVRTGEVPEAEMVKRLELALGDLSIPNPVHHAASAVLAQGGVVWTGNYDELIEVAASDDAVDYHLLSPGDDLSCTCDLGHLVKPYGTLSGGLRQSFVEEVPAEWTARLTTDFSDADVAVFGYSGRDAALRGALLGALAMAADTVWFALESDRDIALEYIAPDRFRAVLPDRCPGFVGWCLERGIHVQQVPLDTKASTARLRIVDESKRLVDILSADPDALHGISWRQFEQVTAELLARGGYGVELTRGSKDGGVDVFAWREDPFVGRVHFLVQCKHSRKYPVGVGKVRDLYGLVHAHHAAKGILVTSSVFTTGAEAFADLFRTQLSLRNHLEVKAWLQSVRPDR